MECHILLEDRTGSKNANYNNNGNVLLDTCMVPPPKRPGGGDMNAEMEMVADQFRAKTASKVYTIPGGGSNPTGALGYVNCAFEMLSHRSTTAV